LKKFEKNFQQAFRITNAGKLDWMKTIRKLNNRLKRTFGSTFKKFTKKMFTKDYA
jgi:hypothetical protein